LTFRAEPQGLKTPEGLTTGKNLGADDGEVFVAETLGRGTRKDLAHGFDDLRVDLQVLSQLHHVAQVFFDEVNTKVWREGSGAHARAGLETHHAGHGLIEDLAERWTGESPERNHQPGSHERVEHPAGHVTPVCADECPQATRLWFTVVNHYLSSRAVA
jgi:hypothetical protein